MDINEYINLLNKKNSILKDLLKYTKGKEFKISEDEVDRIVYYLDNRQKMYDSLNIVQSKINLKKEYFNNIKNKEVENIIKENDSIINEIFKLDKEKIEIMESILSNIKKEIKSIKSSLKVNNSYLGTYQNVIGSSFFDSSR